jgi:hypothetical protein
MTQIKQFADTAAVSLAYAIDGAGNESEVTATALEYIPFTSEGFQMSKESQTSTAISGDRRVQGSKNTSGSAAGAATMEFGYTPFILDMLQLALMEKWVANDPADGGYWLIDGETREFFLVEKRVRNTIGGTPMNFMERYYGNLVNEATLEIGTSEVITMAVNSMAVFADTHKADASSDADAGGLVATYNTPASYEFADASNNISNIVIKDADGVAMEVVFSDASLTITNNVREQRAVGHEFAAGMGMGKVNVTLAGTVYFYDDTVLNAHMNSDTVSAEITIETRDGTFTVVLPALKSEAPNANAQGENQDYTHSMTLNAERGTVNIGGEERECMIAITHVPAE